jgi:hypothetical protein
VSLTLLQLNTLFRQETDDQSAPYLWSDAEVTDYANDAQNEACRRARLIRDSATAAVCQYAVAINNPVIALDLRVISVRRVKLASRSQPLTRRYLADMDALTPGWEALTGPVTDYVADYQTQAIRLFRTPTATDTLNLTVSRLPLADLAANGDVPEINPAYHRSLRFWMLYRAYSKRDAETNDPQRAKAALAMFEAEFGPRSPAFEEEWAREQYGMDGADGSY